MGMGIESSFERRMQVRWWGITGICFGGCHIHILFSTIFFLNIHFPFQLCFCLDILLLVLMEEVSQFVTNNLSES